MKNFYRLLFAFFCITSSCIAQQWKVVNGPYGGIINCMAVANGRLYVGTNSGAVYESADGGESWKWISRDFDQAGAIPELAVKNNTVFAATVKGIYMYNSDSSSWQLLNHTVTNIKVVRGLQVIGDDIWAGNYNGTAFKSSDMGESWQEMKITSEPNSLIYGFLPFAGRIHAITQAGLFTSSDNGGSWPVRIASVLGGSNGNVSAVQGNVLFLAGGANRSLDSGKSWSRIPGIPQGFTVSAIAADDARLYIGTFLAGVYISTDRGETCVPLNNGLMSLNIMNIEIINGQVYASTQEGFLYRLETVANAPDPGPEGSEHIAYDPAAHSIRICGDFGSGDRISIQMYDTRGNLVNTIFSGAAWSDRFREFPVQSASPGAYFIRLSTQSFSQVKPVCILH